MFLSSQAMSPPQLLIAYIAAGFCLLDGLALLYRGTQRFLLIQRIKNTPTSKVRSAAVGIVELFGKVICKEEMRSPISLAKCVYWKLEGEYYKRGKHGGWELIFDKTSFNQFYLEDETGRMLIDPQGAEIDIPADYQSTGYLFSGSFLGLFHFQQLDKKVLDFFEREPEIKKVFQKYSSAELRITEYFIAEGDSLYVFGNAVPLEGASSPVAHENLIVQKPTNAPMYISASHEKKALKKLTWSMIEMLALGVVFTAIGLSVLYS